MNNNKEVKKKDKLSKLEWYWIFYDVGNSAFTMVACSLFALFFGILTKDAGIANELSDSIWSYAASVITVLAVLVGPLIGTISDYKDAKKPFFLIFTLLGVVGCVALGIPMNYILWLVIFVIAKVCYNGALMIYDSMLVDVTTDEHMDKVSAYGYALGYIGSCIPFLIGVAIVALGFPSYNGGAATYGDAMSASLACPRGYLICFAINALWWLAFTIPLFKNYKQKYYIARVDKNGKEISGIKSVGQAYSRLFEMFKYAEKHAGVLLFLLAFFFYIDGVYSIIELAMKVASSLGVDNTQALIALVAVQFIAFPSALIIGNLSKRIKNETLILFCICGYLVVTIFAVFICTNWMFWVLAVVVGLFQGGIQSLSRSYFAQIIPKNKSGELFSLFDAFGKGASFLGTLLFGIINQSLMGQTFKVFNIELTSANMGIIPLAVLVFLGLIIFIISIRINRKNKDKIQEENENIDKELNILEE